MPFNQHGGFQFREIVLVCGCEFWFVCEWDWWIWEKRDFRSEGEGFLTLSAWEL